MRKPHRKRDSEFHRRVRGFTIPPVLLLLFAASGCSALIYEIVWYQLLQLAIGSTAVSLGVLLATFMGGLCMAAWRCRGCWPQNGGIRCWCMP